MFFSIFAFYGQSKDAENLLPMNRMNTHTDVDNYLSIKRIVVLSLAITMTYYFLYSLSHYFGRPSLASSNNLEEEAEMEEVHTVGPNNTVFGSLQEQWPGLFRGERFQAGYKFKKPSFGIVLLFNIPFTFLIIFLVFLYNRKIMGRSYWRHRNELLMSIVGTLLIAGLLSSLCTLLQLYLWPYRPGPNRSLIGYVSRGMLGDFPLVAIALVFSYLQRALYQEKKIAVENEILRAENISTRYEALKNQMDPHFLFNSLNTLKSLVEVDVNHAGDFVQQLSSVLRYTLQNKEVVTLAEELDCVRSYCIMMKMRYGDNLLFDHHIDHEKYDNYHVLPLSIQGLIENAIKHNVVSSRHPLTVHVLTDDDNHLIIKNEIQKKVGETEGSGIGLANLSERYLIKWNENVEIFDDGKIFSVTLPLKQNEQIL